MAQSPEWPDLLWIPPRSYTKGRWAGQPTKITVHYTAGAEGYDDAEGGALYDQRRTDGTSSHYYVDADSVVQCVRTTDRSHTALYHGNNEGLHYELCGTAQTRAQWLDVVSRATIRNAAGQMARDMRKYGIPLVRLTGRQVRDSAAKGVCGHVDWTVGWPEDNGTHTDPGPYFPWDVLFDDIRDFLAGTGEGDDMDQDTPVTGAVDVTIGITPAKDITRPLRWWLSAPYAHIIGLEAKVDVLAAAAGEEVQRDAAEAVERAELMAVAKAIQAGDPEALADLLGDRLSAEFVAALERIRIGVDPAGP